MFVALGFLLMGVGSIVSLAGLVWQVVEAFKTSTMWGVFSILGALCLALIPNIVWLVLNWQDGWRPLVVWLGGIIPSLCGLFLLMMESAA